MHRRVSTQARESTLALKPRADVTRSPKQGYQWPREKDMCPTKTLTKKNKKTKKKNNELFAYLGSQMIYPLPSSQFWDEVHSIRRVEALMIAFFPQHGYLMSFVQSNGVLVELLQQQFGCSDHLQEYRL